MGEESDDAVHTDPDETIMEALSTLAYFRWMLSEQRGNAHIRIDPTDGKARHGTETTRLAAGVIPGTDGYEFGWPGTSKTLVEGLHSFLSVIHRPYIPASICYEAVQCSTFVFGVSVLQ
jgi:hypothetical protein